MMPRGAVCLILVAVAAAVTAALLLPHSTAGLHRLLADAGPAMPLIALLAWTLLTPAMFPGSVLAAVCGAAFGVLGGSLMALAGAVAGGLAAFAIARTAAREPVERLVQARPRLARLHALLEQRGFAVMLAARLAPGVPATGLHYAAGVSPVRVRAFAAAIALGALLRTVPYAILGEGVSSGSLTTLLVAGGSIALGGAAAAVLVRQIHRAVAPTAP